MTKIGRCGHSRDIFMHERSMQYSLSLSLCNVDFFHMPRSFIARYRKYILSYTACIKFVVRAINCVYQF